MLAIKRPTVYSIIDSYIRKNQIVSSKRGSPGIRKLLPEHDDYIKNQLIANDVTISLNSIKLALNEKFRIEVSKSTIARHIEDFQYTFKLVSRQPIRRNDQQAVADRYEYAEEFIRLLSLNFEQSFIFVDEVGLNVSMRASRGRAPIGVTPVIRVPALRSRNISMCCAINSTGIIHYKCQTSAYNRLSFLEFIGELLVKLGEMGPFNYVIVMDNVPFHKTAEVRELITSKGFGLKFLPPYSPFLNPIENMFSKMKNIIKRTNPMNEEALLTEINNIHSNGTVTMEDCQGYYQNMMKYIHKSLRKEVIED